jgi:hypothetical protein
MFEKYGQTEGALIDGLRMEEAELMGKVNRILSGGIKEAAEQQELSSLENRLQQVRSKITETDLRSN